MMRTILGWAAAVGIATLITAQVWPGDLDPPGAPAPTMTTLDEIGAAQDPTAPIDHLPFVIESPGSYRVTGNLTGVPASNGILILSDDVTLDLGGFTLTGVPGSLNGVLVSTEVIGGSFTPQENISIHGGHVRGWGVVGVAAPITFGAVIRDVGAARNVSGGITAGAGSVLERCSATGSQVGITVLSGSVLTGCTATSNELVGILAAGDSTIHLCSALLNGAVGISTGERCIITECVANSNGGSVVGIGINVQDDTTVRGCTASDNEDGGISADDDCLIIGNTCIQNNTDNDMESAGISVSGSGNRIEGNQCNDNLLGIEVTDSDNLVVKNWASGNTGTGLPSANFDLSTTANQVGPIISATGTIATDNPWANFER